MTLLLGDTAGSVATYVFLVVSAVGVGTVAGIAARLGRWSRLQRLLRLRFNTPVDVIITTQDEPEAPVGPVTFDRWSTSLGTVQALASISRGIGSMRSRKSVRVHMSRGLSCTAIDDELVLLGGNNHNNYANRFLRYAKFNFPGARLDYNDRNESLNVMALGGQRWHYRWNEEWPEDRSAGAKRDFALIVLWINPFAQFRRRAILCAGFTSIGTAAAARRVFGHFVADAAPRLRKGHFRRALRRELPCCAAVYELELDGDEVINWTLLAFETLQGPQNPRALRHPGSIPLVLRGSTLEDTAERAAATELLASAFRMQHPAGCDGTWTQRKPTFRLVALDGDVVVGHIGVVTLSTHELDVMGVSDLVVREDRRGIGLGRRLIEEAVNQAWTQGADVLLIATAVPPVLRVVRDLRFEDTTGERFFYVDENGSRRRNRDWRHATRRGVELPDEVELTSDF